MKTGPLKVFYITTTYSSKLLFKTEKKPTCCISDATYRCICMKRSDQKSTSSSHKIGNVIVSKWTEWQTQQLITETTAVAKTQANYEKKSGLHTERHACRELQVPSITARGKARGFIVGGVWRRASKPSQQSPPPIF